MNPRFDLIDMIQTAYRRRRFIIWITLAAACLGAVCYLLQKKRYKATAEFIVANPMYADRNHFFRISGDRYVDYFAGEDDIDRVLAIAQSSAVRNEVVARMGLFAKYKLDPSNKEDAFNMGLLWKKNFNVFRTEYKNMELSFTDEDPQLAANVTNETIKVTEQLYRGYYNNIKAVMHRSLQEKMNEADSMLLLLTDSLARLRERYNIYDIVNPVRDNILVGSIKSNGRPDFGWGMEQLQNVESIKDKWVSERTRFLGLLNEFSTGTKPEDLSFIKMLSDAVPPVKPTGLGFVLTTIACAFAGLFLGVVIVLLQAWFRLLISVKR